MAYGDITYKDNRAVAAGFGYPGIGHLAGDYAVTFGRTPPGEPLIQTWVIDDVGTIASSATDAWEYAGFSSGYAEMTSISPEKYIITDGFYGYSLTISNTGVITKTMIDNIDINASMDFASFYGFTETGNANNIYFINDCQSIRSFACSAAGVFGGSGSDIIDMQNYSSAHPGNEFANIVNLNGNYYASVYDDIIQTFSTDGNGIMTDVATWDWTTSAYASNILKVYGTTKYIIAGNTIGQPGKLSTVDISNTGTITESIIDTLTYETRDLKYTSNGINTLIYCGGDIYAVISVYDYFGQTEGEVYTFTCDSTGTLSNSILGTYTFYQNPSDISLNFRVTRLQGNIYAVSYSEGPNNNGRIKTFSIDAPPIVPPPNPGGDINWAHTKVKG